MNAHTRQAGSNGSYFLLLIFSNSSLNCSKIFKTSELSVLPLTPKNIQSNMLKQNEVSDR